MARTGVTYGEVVEAATELVGKGRNPTVEQVRLLIGSGSSTTIANHLRQWKANNDESSLLATKENIPSELVAVMKGLWEQVLNQSQIKIEEVETNYRVTIDELQQELIKYKTNNQKWQKLFDQWQQEKTTLANEKLTLEQALDFSHKENQSLHGKYDGLLQQLQEKQERIEELHRLHQQTQANLEHYRESAREQRLLDQQQHEQQKQQLQFEIKNINEQLIVQREKTHVLQQNNQILIQSNTTLEQKNSHAQSQLKEINIKLEEAEKAEQKHLNASLYWQNLFDELQKKLDLKINQFVDIQSENNLLLQQQTEIKQALKNSQDQNKLLSQEKWELAQEKAHLEGRLRQMQDSIVT